MTELPDGMFAYSDVETLLLLAHGPNRGMVEVRRAAVHRQDLQRFFTTGQPTWSSTEVVPSAEAAHAGSLWRPPLQPVWQALGSYPQLGAVAEVHRGLEYVIPLRERRKELESDQPREGFLRGLMNVQKDYEPFRTAAATYLNTSTELIRRGADLATKWEKPKVIVNRHRKSRAAWPLVAALDRQGLILYHNFYGIWPTGEWTIEALAAVLEGAEHEDPRWRHRATVT